MQLSWVGRVVLSVMLVLGALGPLNGQELSDEEQALYEMIMAYRAKKRLPEIPLSKSLTVVARAHVVDLTENQPVRGRCNLHSWSAEGNWSRCCYTQNPKSYPCMWDKPRELTSYTGDGYEIAYWSSGGATAQEGLDGWKKSKGHNAVLVNKGIWRDVQWQAIGIAIHGNYAVVWFGKEPDVE